MHPVNNKMAKIAFIIFALIPSIFCACSIEQARQFFSRSVNEYTVELVNRLGQDTEYHFVASTLSSWTLLAQTSFGAAGSTLDELRHVLRLPRVKCYNRKFFEVALEIYHPVGQTTLQGASAVFIDERYPVKETFLNEIKNAAISQVKRVSVGNVDAVATNVNDYVRTATDGAINEVVQASDLEDVVMLIVDVLRFKGNWQMPFPEDKTEQSDFFDEKGNKLGTVNLMQITSEFNVKSYDPIKASLVELPYNDERFSMLLIIPYDEVKLSTVINSLKMFSLKSIFDLFKFQETQECTILLPRFKLMSELNNLKELLMDMGLTSVFDNRAEFSGISDYPLFISNLVQKADIEVNEIGTTASAATEAEFSFKSMPFTLSANRPFSYMIVDKQTAIPVFAGAYSKPSLY